MSANKQKPLKEEIVYVPNVKWQLIYWTMEVIELIGGKPVFKGNGINEIVLRTVVLMNNQDKRGDEIDQYLLDEPRCDSDEREYIMDSIYKYRDPETYRQAAMEEIKHRADKTLSDFATNKQQPEMVKERPEPIELYKNEASEMYKLVEVKTRRVLAELPIDTLGALDGARIVTAVNSYDDMLEALKCALSYLQAPGTNGNHIAPIVESAIAKATNTK